MTFHIDLAWYHCRRSCRCSGVKGSARKGRLDSRFASARCLEIVCGTIATPTSAGIVERVTVGSTSACRTILPSSLLVVFLVTPDPVFLAWVPSRFHCSQQFLTAHSERSTWPATRRVDQPVVFIPMIRPLSNSLNCEKCLLARLHGMFRLPKSSYNRLLIVTFMNLRICAGLYSTLFLIVAPPRRVDRSECAVRNCWEQWKREGTHVRKTGSGVTRKTTRREDGRIVRQALVDPTVTRSTIPADVGVAIVPQTISRHLAEANLESKRPFRALPLTPEHRQLRLQWYQARSMWNVIDWQKVVFSDESRFVLGTEDNRVRVWRRPGERYNSPHTVLHHTARTSGVMVWGTIAYDNRSTLIVMRGTLMSQRYVDDILRPHVGLFLNGLLGAYFQQDNARPHTARVSQDFLRHFRLFHGQPAPPICPL
ncbi:transposable element Tcb1 transposase [Trichonephila clavipes]|nr:transposable element Tcb1 transposase [Trichonephila clavipes]